MHDGVVLMKIATTLISSIVISASCHATVFQCAKGDFRDTPCPNGKSITVSSKSTSAPTKALSPQQKKLCQNMGKYAESVVDLYISGTSRAEAIQQIDANVLTDTNRELLKKIANSSYDELINIGTIRSQDARDALKGTMNIKGELMCLESFSIK